MSELTKLEIKKMTLEIQFMEAFGNLERIKTAVHLCECIKMITNERVRLDIVPK